MKNIKYLFLLLVVILFTGCTVKYDLNIDSDLSVTEKVEAEEKEYDAKTKTGMDTDKIVNHLYEIYKRDGIKPSISSKVENNNIIATASTSHNSLDDYVDNFSSDLFKTANLSKSGNSYTLTFKQTEKLSSTDSTAPIYDKVVFNITTPFKVTKSNVDKVSGNKYTWEFEKDQELRTIKITFDTTVNDNAKVIDLGLFKIKINYSVLFLVIMILVIIGIVGVVYVNNKKNNKF